MVSAVVNQKLDTHYSPLFGGVLHPFNHNQHFPFPNSPLHYLLTVFNKPIYLNT